MFGTAVHQFKETLDPQLNIASQKTLDIFQSKKLNIVDQEVDSQGHSGQIRTAHILGAEK